MNKHENLYQIFSTGNIIIMNNKYLFKTKLSFQSLFFIMVLLWNDNIYIKFSRLFAKVLRYIAKFLHFKTRWKIWLKRKQQQRELSKAVYLVKRRWWPLPFCKWRNSFYTSANYKILWLIFLRKVVASLSHGWFHKLALKNPT